MPNTNSSAQLPSKAAFETIIDGKKTALFILKNSNGMQVAITNYGGCIVSILVPDKTGEITDVNEGFDSIEGYLNATDPYYGALIGRFGNRIANGQFVLDGKTYDLHINNGPNSLHGGKAGFNAVVWDAKQSDDVTLELSYLSKDMEEGFPGNLEVKVTYLLTENNGLQIHYHAVTDKTTVVNLTSHPYFNLNGVGNGDILGHTIQIFADSYIPVDAASIPTGEIAPVKGTPFDFTLPEKIGANIDLEDTQIKYGAGYDHTFVFNNHGDSTLAAIVTAEQSGIQMEVFTDEPGMQFYTGNFMPGKNTMKYGHQDERRTAFAMETQHYPDSPNKPQFPSTTLKPGEVYKTSTEYRFSVVK